MTRPSLPEVFTRFYAYYTVHPEWGTLHVVLSDGNHGDEIVKNCIHYADGARADPSVLVPNAAWATRFRVRVADVPEGMRRRKGVAGVGGARYGAAMIDISGLTTTAINIPVRWAVTPDNEHYWRQGIIDRFLRWRPEPAAWCSLQCAFGLGIPPRPEAYTWSPRYNVVEYTGNLLGFGFADQSAIALVMESTRMLIVLPVSALRVEP